MVMLLIMMEKSFTYTNFHIKQFVHVYKNKPLAMNSIPTI